MRHARRGGGKFASTAGQVDAENLSHSSVPGMEKRKFHHCRRLFLAIRPVVTKQAFRTSKYSFTARKFCGSPTLRVTFMHKRLFHFLRPLGHSFGSREGFKALAVK